MHEREGEKEKAWWLHVGEVTQAVSMGIKERKHGLCSWSTACYLSCSRMLIARTTLLASSSANRDSLSWPDFPCIPPPLGRYLKSLGKASTWAHTWWSRWSFRKAVIKTQDRRHYKTLLFLGDPFCSSTFRDSRLGFVKQSTQVHPFHRRSYPGRALKR